MISPVKRRKEKNQRKYKRWKNVNKGNKNQISLLFQLIHLNVVLIYRIFQKINLQIGQGKSTQKLIPIFWLIYLNEKTNSNNQKILKKKFFLFKIIKTPNIKIYSNLPLSKSNKKNQKKNNITKIKTMIYLTLVHVSQ